MFSKLFNQQKDRKGDIFKKKNILITGGAGFIGSNLCDALVAENNVICVDNFISGFERNIDHLLAYPNFRFLRHDIIEPLLLEDARELDAFNIRFQGIQEIYHLACPHSPLDYAAQEEATLLVNTMGMRNILNIAKKYNARFVHFSSSVVYGPRPPDARPFVESDIGQVDHLSARAVYDEGKRFSETVVNYYERTYNIDAKIIRLFRTYGPRMPLNKGHMIPDFALAALDNEDLVIHGDKTFTTSLCYIQDVVDASIKTMRAKKGLGVVNIGSPEVYSFEDIARLFLQLTSSPSKILFGKDLLMMTPLGIPDITKAKKTLGWLPLIGLEKGMTLTFEYIKAQKSLLHL